MPGGVLGSQGLATPSPRAAPACGYGFQLPGSMSDLEPVNLALSTDEVIGDMTVST